MDIIPAILPYQVICDASELPTVTIFTCKEPANGGYNCTLFNPITHAVEDEVLSAWNVTEYTDDLQMFVPFDTWWMEVEGDDFTLECYNWEDATDPFSDFPYIFQLADLACDVGIVFECIDETLCQDVRPNEDDSENVWYDLPYKQDPQQPEFIPKMSCSEFELGYPYLMEDNVCNEYEDLFTCVDAISCAFSFPTYYDNMVWELVEPVYVNYVDAIEVDTIDCTTYDAILDGADAGDFAIGDITCDSDRAWSCAYIKNCNSFSPSYTYFNEIRGWELLQVNANVDYTFEETKYSSVQLETFSDCVPLGMLTRTAPQVASADIWASPVTVGDFTVTDGVVCADTDAMKAIIHSTRYVAGTFDFAEFEEASMDIYDEAYEAFISSIYTAAGLTEASYIADLNELDQLSRDYSIWMYDEDKLEIVHAACLADATDCFTQSPDANSTVFLEQLATAIETLSTTIDTNSEAFDTALDSADAETWINDNFADDIAETLLPANL